MRNVHFLKAEAESLPATASLLNLCRRGFTKCFSLHHRTTDELHLFASLQLREGQYALYSQSNLGLGEAGLFHLEHVAKGGLGDAIQDAQRFLGPGWMVLKG